MIDTVADFSVPFQLVTPKGRVLLKITRAYRETITATTQYDYVEPGHGGGYGVDIVGVCKLVDGIKIDFPTAKVVGFFPDPEILKL